MKIETCPVCGHNLLNIITTTYPEIPSKRCTNCGWYWEEKREDVERITFKDGEEMIMDGWKTECYISEVEKNKQYQDFAKTTGGTGTSKTINPPAQIGWICPKCGAGLSPWATRCPCQDKWEITC